jgi:hypothetical protein
LVAVKTRKLSLKIEFEGKLTHIAIILYVSTWWLLPPFVA